MKGFNPLMTNRLAHHYLLGVSIVILGALGVILNFNLLFR